MPLTGRVEGFYRTLCRAISSLRGNLVTGLRLTLPFPARELRVNPSLGQFFAVLGVLWGLSATNDLIDAGMQAEYSPWGVLSHAALSYFWIAILALIVLLDRRAAQFLLLAVTVASASITLLSAWIIGTNLWWEIHPESYREYYAALWRGFLVWEVLVFTRVVATLYRAPWRRVVLHSLSYAVAIYAVVIYLPQRAIFIEPWEPEGQSRVDVEATYYAQPNLLAQSLYTLSPQRPGVVDLYFVGFGSYAYQDVFQREIEQATIIFEQQFGSIGRTVALINNVDTLNVVPLANRHNLEKTIRGIAERIASEEDIVVLFLSSHGAEDATISVDLSNFRLNDLSAAEVREILDENAIKWRIVIVSACYSGSFIEALASPTTLVITAAAADRSSFGCDQENEWTYFGEAYFEQALKQTPSFISAFERAREIIAERESSESREASNPQISIGGEIGAYLTEQNL